MEEHGQANSVQLGSVFFFSLGPKNCQISRLVFSSSFLFYFIYLLI
jgi:hypothetical protein